MTSSYGDDRRRHEVAVTFISSGETCELQATILKVGAVLTRRLTSVLSHFALDLRASP